MFKQNFAKQPNLASNLQFSFSFSDTYTITCGSHWIWVIRNFYHDQILLQEIKLSQAWWLTPVILILWRLKVEALVWVSSLARATEWDLNLEQNPKQPTKQTENPRKKGEDLPQFIMRSYMAELHGRTARQTCEPAQLAIYHYIPTIIKRMFEHLRKSIALMVTILPINTFCRVLLIPNVVSMKYLVCAIQGCFYNMVQG